VQTTAASVAEVGAANATDSGMDAACCSWSAPSAKVALRVSVLVPTAISQVTSTLSAVVVPPSTWMYGVAVT
jgi:hypothetical protein